METKNTPWIFIVLIILVTISIITTYYSKVILKDYTVIYTETGLPNLDEE